MKKKNRRIAGAALALTLLATSAWAADVADIGLAPVPPVMSRAEIEAGLKSHDRALFLTNGWIRDPFLVRGPDDYYYLTGTTIDENDAREKTDPYNVGLKDTSAVGNTVRLWRSQDLIDWKYRGVIFSQKDQVIKGGRAALWAPELHWVPEMKRWALVYCPKSKSDFALSEGPELKGPWTHPLGAKFKGHHDPSLIQNGDTWWAISGNADIEPLAPDFSKFTAKPLHIDPSGSRPDPENAGKTISRIGHEGTTILKIGDKYAYIGTAWSTDLGRKGSYNLYYATADKITGPYGPRKFVGRFLGHGTPFQTRDGKWWCTGFFNGNSLPLPKEEIEQKDLSKDAQTINPRGLAIVPLDVRTLPDGDIYMRAIDPAYATPGPDEAQKF